MEKMERIWAVRGATTVEEDRPETVLAATRELLTVLFEKNRISPEQIVSVIFTTTPDITSEFPAVAARQLGLTDTPLMCAAEIAKPGALSRCIRVMIHFYTALEKHQIIPVYLRDAVKLRPDLQSR